MPPKYWTQAINSVVGCQSVGDKCDRCWAESVAHRMAHNDAVRDFVGRPGELTGEGAAFARGKWTGRVKLHTERMKPKLWRKGQVVAMCWMGDLFSHLVPLSFQLAQIETTVQDAITRHGKGLPMNRYLYLTSRPERMVEVVRIALKAGLRDRLAGSTNGQILRSAAMGATHWFGASAWDSYSWDQAAKHLIHLPTKRWLSLEPWIRPINFKHRPPAPWSWVVAGAETGTGARPAHDAWFQGLRDYCEASGIAFYLKQLDGRGRRYLDNKEHSDYPWEAN